MATLLDKDLLRESTVKADDRNVMVTLGADQSIKLKLKGMKSGEVSINILDLWKQLNGIEESESNEPQVKKPLVIEAMDDEEMRATKDNPMIPLHDIRTRLCVSLPAEIITKVDPIINEFVDDHKKKLKAEAQAKKTKKK